MEPRQGDVRDLHAEAERGPLTAERELLEHELPPFAERAWAPEILQSGAVDGA